MGTPWQQEQQILWTGTAQLADLRNKVGGLTPGTPYQFEMKALFSPGGSGPRSNVVIATPSGVPDAPDVTATAGDGLVALAWTTPPDGAPTVGYVLKYRPTGGTWQPWAFSGTGTSTTVSSLTNGVTYEFEVAGQPDGHAALRRLRLPALGHHAQFGHRCDHCLGGRRCGFLPVVLPSSRDRTAGPGCKGHVDGQRRRLAARPAADLPGPHRRARRERALFAAADLPGLHGPAHLPSTTGGKGPLTYSLTRGQLPPGLTLDPVTGEIRGTPTGPAGAAFVEITVSDQYTSTATAVVLAVGPDPASIPTLSELGGGRSFPPRGPSS